MDIFTPEISFKQLNGIHQAFYAGLSHETDFALHKLEMKFGHRPDVDVTRSKEFREYRTTVKDHIHGW